MRTSTIVIAIIASLATATPLSIRSPGWAAGDIRTPETLLREQMLQREEQERWEREQSELRRKKEREWNLRRAREQEIRIFGLHPN
ncbi:hypothetical protein XA68_18208 [Ophiocordyceps unilateralis]|uniref:Uncharacterized protein n=1 Tax=Ophiocordyceps unilateralis TaxID=268505 RepID=A0A2A9PQ60_OPHUN|nr:hypothetical protein XA68_18208 [Ophiocordyceps unilateralis]